MTTPLAILEKAERASTGIPFSVLDLSPVPEGSTAADALHNTLDLAQHAEAWGYNRYWLAEHHNMPGIASAATAVTLGYVAGGTSTIRIGAGGIMLPNHSPLVVAEQFGTLETLYPGRIDLGLGRAPGTDPATALALGRDQGRASDTFPDDVKTLLSYFKDPQPNQRVHAFPGEGLNVPVWLLGSSLFSAELAARMGLPYGYAAHFSPTHLIDALKIYRDNFEPSEYLAKPYAIVGVNVIAAETDREAQRLFTSQLQQFTNIRRGRPTKLPLPVQTMEGLWMPWEEQNAIQTFEYAIIGSYKSVESGLKWFLKETQADELLLTAHIYDHSARLRSFEMIAEIRKNLNNSVLQTSAAA